MELQSATIRNIQFAWSRILDIDEEEMADASTRTYRESRDSPLLMFVSLFGKGVLVGPAWAMAAARTLTDAQLARHSVLLELSRPHNGQALGEASLFFCDTVPPAADPPLPVSLGRNDAVMLESACLPEDAEEAGLSGTEHVWILMDGRDSPARPVAGAGYNVWAGALAHMGVLTAPGERFRGHALRVSQLAAEAAITAGLIPQWRARTDNAASCRTALRAGFVHAGSQTSVILPSAGT